MPTHPDIVPADLPLGTRLQRAPLYPLRGAAGAAVAALAVAHALADLIPGIVGWAGSVLVWASIILYAMECLRRTADGYADPPEVTLYNNSGPAISMICLQVLQLVALFFTAHGQPMLWLLVFALIVLLPAIALSLAFEDALLAALNPVRWATAIGAFGVAYAIPVALGVLEGLFYLVQSSHTGWMARSLWFVPVVYLCLLQFHVLGALMHRNHERLGHTPDADLLAEASGRNRDHELLQQVDRLASGGQHAHAETLLRERIRERHAPLDVHARYRRLLQARGDHDALLAHAQTQLALLLSEDRTRPALGLVRECMEADPKFMPDHPETVARLADAAAAQGMMQLAVRLARGYPNAWPRDPQAPRYGLLAARLMAERLDRRAEAGVLAAKLLRAYASHPMRGDIEAFLEALDMHPDTGPSAA